MSVCLPDDVDDLSKNCKSVSQASLFYSHIRINRQNVTILHFLPHRRQFLAVYSNVAVKYHGRRNRLTIRAQINIIIIDERVVSTRNLSMDAREGGWIHLRFSKRLPTPASCNYSRAR